MLGSGEAPLEAGCAPRPRSRRVGVHIGYDESLAHLIQGGCDALLVPSRFEPCGLTQLCALRYGSLPVVAHVGGLCDTVIDANEMALAAGIGTGFHFAPVQTEMLAAAILRALAVWRQPDIWRRLQRNAMQTDVSWRRPAARYAALYRSLCGATDAAIVSCMTKMARARHGYRCCSSGTTRTGDLAVRSAAPRRARRAWRVARPYGPGEQRAHATVDGGRAAARPAHRA